MDSNSPLGVCPNCSSVTDIRYYPGGHGDEQSLENWSVESHEFLEEECEGVGEMPVEIKTSIPVIN